MAFVYRQSALMLLLSSCVFITCCAFSFNLRKLSDNLVQNMAIEEKQKFVNLNDLAAIVSSGARNNVENLHQHKQAPTSKLSGSPIKNLKSFRWEDCGSKKEEMNITTLAIGPDPLALPGNISVKTAVNIKQTLKAPIQLELEVEKHEAFFWLKIPCIDGIGSCVYSDICQRLKGATCPPDFVKQGIPCKCPFTGGSYNLTGSYHVGQDVPSGDYRITTNLSSGGKQIICLKLYATIG